MYNNFYEENIQDVLTYLYEKDVINKERYPNPSVQLTKTIEDSIALIKIVCYSNSTTYVGDIPDYFYWKTMRDRKLKLLKIMKNVQ